MDIQLSIQELKQLVEQYYAAGQLPSFLTGLLVGIVAVLVVIRIIRKMDKTYNLLQSQILEYKASTSALSSENYRLRSEVEEKERRNTELIGERNTYRMEAEAARTRLGDAALAAQDYQRQILSLENQIADLAFSVTGFSGQLRDISNTDGQFWTKKPTVPIHRFHHINERKCPIISVVNFKGGVGKTHITANLGASLARAGYRTLLIDLDHQGSLTQLVLNSQEDEDAIHMGRRVEPVLKEPTAEMLLRCITKCTECEGEMSVVGTGQSLAAIENQLMMQWLSNGCDDDIRYRLRKAIHDPAVYSKYDFILIDCPPRLTTSCINAMAASDYVLVPVLLEERTTETVPRMLQWLGILQKTSCPDLNLLGVVGNKAAPRTKIIQREQNVWNDLRDRCQSVMGDTPRMFESIIREHSTINGRFAALDSRHLPMYQDLADLIMQEIPKHARRQPEFLS